MISHYDRKKDLTLLLAIDPEFHLLDTPRLVIKVSLPFGYIAYRHEKKMIRIHRLRVKPEYRCMGVGSELLDCIKNVSRVYIIVHEENECLNWLLKRGFLAIGMSETFPDGRSGIRFEKVL